MPINSTPVTHAQSFSTVNGAEGVNIATREIFENIAWESINQFEGLMLRNSFIASNNYEGGMNDTVSPQTVTMNNPAGTFRSILKPKGNVEDFKPITGLADVKFTKFSADEITLKIDTYITSDIELIYEVDGAQGSWLVDDIKSAAQNVAISDIVRFVNYKTYNVLKNGALGQIDPILGAQGRVKQASADPAQFTKDFITDIAGVKALPEDRYVSGFKEADLAAVTSPTGHSKILQEKLVIFDGQFVGAEGKFFTGLPYTHRFAGIALIESIWLNSGSAAEFDYIGMPIGKWSPFLFHLAKFAGRAEVAPFTDGAIGVYGTNLHGMKVEEKLDQYMFARTVEAPVKNFTTQLLAPKVEATASDKVKITYKATGTTGDVLYRMNPAGEALPTTWTKVPVNGEVSGLKSGTSYVVEIASAKSGETSPEIGTNGKAFVILKSVKTL